MNGVRIRFVRLFATFLAVLVGAISSASGPTSSLEFVAGGSLYDLQGVKLTSSSLNFADEAAPVVEGNSIVTVGSNPYEMGSYYHLDGSSDFGVTYNHLGTTILDATTDDAHNFFLNASGDLVSTKLDFSGPLTVTHLGRSFASGGISYDKADDAFWVSNNGFVEEVARNGSVLTNFETGVDSNGLAFDSADQSLWLSDVNGTILYQFSSSGERLSSNDLHLGSSIRGLEFAVNPTPEPATVVALLSGFGLLARPKRRVSRAWKPLSTDLEVNL